MSKYKCVLGENALGRDRGLSTFSIPFQINELFKSQKHEYVLLEKTSYFPLNPKTHFESNL
jgi:hypothetical protein